MKELKLLAEDWKGEIDYSRAAVILTEFGSLYAKDTSEDVFVCSNSRSEVHESHFNKLENNAILAAYNAINDDGFTLELMKPEPRPADSIKLSECDAHIITGVSISGQLEVISKEYDAGYTGQNVWVCRQKGMFLISAYCPARVASLRELTSIKIFDMTED